MSAKFFTRRFFLDTPTTRSRGRGGENFVGPFKSFWVSNTNNASFDCELVINPLEDGRGIPLRLNQCQSFQEKPDGACIEFSTAQPGVWIDITFAQDDVMDVGSVAVDITGEVILNEGSTHSSSVLSITTAPSVVFVADDTRKLGVIQNKGMGIIYVGNDTVSELQHADFKNICEEIAPGGLFIWRNKGALSARSDTGTIKISRRVEF